MKKHVLIFLALCLAFLTACSSRQTASTPDLASASAQEQSMPSAESQTGSSKDAQSGGQAESEKPSESAAPGSASATSSQKPPQVVQLTFPEGSTFMQFANKLEEAGVCTAKSFYDTAQSYTVKSFTVPESGDRCFKMEGYLFPDTYQFTQGEDPEDVLRKLLNNYAAKSGMPSDKTLILASVVEKEARSARHRALVASVFQNRLNLGMRLEADPTREYVNQNITGNSLVENPEKYAALYNTYKCAALPAGPICSPGAAAIRAAASPAASDYLFFFFGKDNDNHYSTTLEEHQALMEQYGVEYGM